MLKDIFFHITPLSLSEALMNIFVNNLLTPNGKGISSDPQTQSVCQNRGFRHIYHFVKTNNPLMTLFYCTLLIQNTTETGTYPSPICTRWNKLYHDQNKIHDTLNIFHLHFQRYSKHMTKRARVPSSGKEV